MNQETFDALKLVVAEAKKLQGEKWGNRKRLNQQEVWRTAMLTREIKTMENHIDEISKEYK